MTFSLPEQDRHDRWLLRFPTPRLSASRPWTTPIPDHRIVSAYRHQVVLVPREMQRIRIM
jgi:hypothetical protein